MTIYKSIETQIAFETLVDSFKCFKKIKIKNAGTLTGFNHLML